MKKNSHGKWMQVKKKTTTTANGEENKGKKIKQNSWNEKHFLMLSWMGSMCLHAQSHLPSAVCSVCDCRHRLALHNSFQGCLDENAPDICNATEFPLPNTFTSLHVSISSVSFTIMGECRVSKTGGDRRVLRNECKRVQFYYPMLCTIVKRAQSRFVISS